MSKQEKKPWSVLIEEGCRIWGKAIEKNVQPRELTFDRGYPGDVPVKVTALVPLTDPGPAPPFKPKKVEEKKEPQLKK